MIYEEILKAFQKAKVKYVLVGGLAVNLLGYPRFTADLDILAEMTDSNLRKIVKVLRSAGYRIRQPVDPMGIADKKTREDWIKKKHLKSLNFYDAKSIKQVDILIHSPVSYKVARRTALRETAGGLRLHVISIENLIKMKGKTGRSVDETDVQVLRQLLRLKRAAR